MTARAQRLRTALVHAVIPLRALQMSATWELCDTIKRGIAEAIVIADAVLAETEPLSPDSLAPRRFSHSWRHGS